MTSFRATVARMFSLMYSDAQERFGDILPIVLAVALVGGGFIASIIVMGLLTVVLLYLVFPGWTVEAIVTALANNRSPWEFAVIIGQVEFLIGVPLYLTFSWVWTYWKKAKGYKDA